MMERIFYKFEFFERKKTIEFEIDYSKYIQVTFFLIRGENNVGVGF